ncbi:FdhE protein [Bradyrhizobium sp. NFR13]|jgi:FdhE protein|uniref:formate dehydrogenase accessory protein FdhE n=1 Tax=Bradyrhizobium sp. NFR13 TaxID=1566285 RepID=UPI0008E090CD|nr:formate dehydrogenase accessory protein FdhE [Bradyrhizobium sp. NFR13]SFM10285.1 FdhE protein [Bradyrhizobium sp. NFR13]
MDKVDTPGRAPVPIGEIAEPPFVRLPDPSTLFQLRAERFRDLAVGNELAPFLYFLADLSSCQHRLQDDLPDVDLPTSEDRERARAYGMPPLDRNRFTVDAAFDVTLGRLLQAVSLIEMPDTARTALARVTGADSEARIAMARAVLANEIPVEEFAEHVFVAAALQVHFARLASKLNAKKLVPVGDGVCPSCGGAPVASMVVGWRGAHGARYCMCSLCATQWHYVRIKCTLCSSTKGIAYREIEGGDGTVLAETCESCRGYVKILHQHKKPELDPMADDVASLGLDLLLREDDYWRGGLNLFLLGY